MNNPVRSKGAVNSQLNGIKSIPIVYGFFEIIDNRKHSNSKKVFIDINIHNGNCCIGYSECASEDNINNTVKWFNTNNNQKDVDNIASKGIGLKFFQFKLLGKWKQISLFEDISNIDSEDKSKFFYTEMNSIIIDNARKDTSISEKKFDTILTKQTTFIRYDDELKRSEENIFKNIDSKYPFLPKTIFLGKKINITNSFNKYKKYDDDDNCIGYNFEDIIKHITIKYYYEIYNNDLELFIKLPGYTEFEQIKAIDGRDIIGTTNKSDKLKIDIFIDDKTYLGHTFRINENSYKFCSNGSSKRREKIKNIISLKPDYILTQYINNNIEKQHMVGKSVEQLYTGLFIKIGGTFINSVKTKWNIDERNLWGHSAYRAVLECNSEKSKQTLKLDGLKALFDLSCMNNLHNVCVECTKIYKNYMKQHKPDNPDNYTVVTSSSNKTSKKNKNISGYFYVIEIGENFYKFGQSSNRTRIWSYANNTTIKKHKKKYKDINIYDKPFVKYLSLTKINRIHEFEQEFKSYINENTRCQTYDHIKGNDILEYFKTKKWKKIEIEIKNKIQKYK